MKKVLLSSVLFAGLFLISCGSDDDGIESNNAPSEAVLTISGESGLSIDLTWGEVVDVDGDIVAYDLYVKDEIVESNLTTVNYTWTAEGQNDIDYPVVFTVVSKDINGGETISNEVVLDDPIIGEWNLSSRFILDDKGEIIENVFEGNECLSMEYVEFISDGNYLYLSYNQTGEICDERVSLDGIWENSGNKNYFFEFPSIENSGNVSQTDFEENKVIFSSDEAISIYIKK